MQTKFSRSHGMPAPKPLDCPRRVTRQSLWISGYFGRNNVGDEALLASVLGNRPERVELTVFSSVPPPRIRAIHNCSCIQEPPFDQRAGKYGLVYGAGFWLRKGMGFWLSARRNRALVIAGGGLINDHVAGRVVGIRKRVDAVRGLGVNVALLGVGVDPLTVPEDREAALQLSERVSYFSVRDECSEQSLLDVGIEPHRFRRGADLAFALPVDPRLETAVRADDLSKAVVGLNLRPLFDLQHERGSRKRERRDEYVRQCQNLVTHLASMVGELVLIPFNPQDVVFLEEVAGHSAKVLEFSPNPHRILAHMKAIDALVGMRYHSLVFATLRHVPFVPIVYGPKAAALAEELGISWRSLAVGDGTETLDQPLDAEAVLESVKQVWESRAHFKDRCAELVSRKRIAAVEDIRRCMAAMSGTENG